MSRSPTYDGSLCRRARSLHRPRVMVDTGEPREMPAADASSVLRDQEAEFYEAVLLLLTRMPPGSTVEQALASHEGQRTRQKWALKYGRRPPLMHLRIPDPGE